MIFDLIIKTFLLFFYTIVHIQCVVYFMKKNKKYLGTLDSKATFNITAFLSIIFV